MNRTIKFRAKRKGSPHEWLIGDLAHIEDKVYIFDRGNNAPLNSPDWYEVIPETVGQFTGILDKKGKDIYEGGILCREGHFGIQVVHDKGMRVMDIEPVRFNNKCLYAHIEDFDLTEWMVYGNIHDNPELLK